MMRLAFAFGALIALGCLNSSAQTVPSVRPCVGTNPCVPVSNANPLPTSGSSTVTGSVSNASSGVATSSTNLGAVSWLYGFNGTSWDQLQVDANKTLKVSPTSWAGTVLGAPSNFGTTPTAVIVPGVNASLFVGTTVADGNSGNKSAGTLRVVAATDQLALATWGHVATGAAPPSGSTYVGCLTTTSITGGSNNTVSGFNCTPAGALRADTATLAGTTIDTNSGNKSAGTQRVVLATDQPALTTAMPVSVGPHAATLSTAAINISSSGDNIIVTRSVGTIKIYRMNAVCASGVTMTMKNGAGTSLSGAMPGVTQFYLPFENGEPHYTTTSTNNFIINLGTAVSCQGTVWYVDS